MKNKQALINVAEWLEDGAPHTEVAGHKIATFDMEYAVDAAGQCGTACCIAGAIVQFENLIEPVYTGVRDFFDTHGEAGVGTMASEHLGISSGDAEQLFEPWIGFEYNSYSEFSDPARAAKVVRHYLKTDNVDWDLFPPSEEFCTDGEE